MPDRRADKKPRLPKLVWKLVGLVVVGLVVVWTTVMNDSQLHSLPSPASKTRMALPPATAENFTAVVVDASLDSKATVRLSEDHPVVRQLSMLAKLARSPQTNSAASAFDPATIASLGERDVDRAIASLGDQLELMRKRKRQLESSRGRQLESSRGAGPRGRVIEAGGANDAPGSGSGSDSDSGGGGDGATASSIEPSLLWTQQGFDPLPVVHLPTPGVSEQCVVVDEFTTSACLVLPSALSQSWHECLQSTNGKTALGIKTSAKYRVDVQFDFANPSCKVASDLQSGQLLVHLGLNSLQRLEMPPQVLMMAALPSMTGGTTAAGTEGKAQPWFNAGTLFMAAGQHQVWAQSQCPMSRARACLVSGSDPALADSEGLDQCPLPLVPLDLHTVAAPPKLCENHPKWRPFSKQDPDTGEITAIKEACPSGHLTLRVSRPQNAITYSSFASQPLLSQAIKNASHCNCGRGCNCGILERSIVEAVIVDCIDGSGKSDGDPQKVKGDPATDQAAAEKHGDPQNVDGGTRPYRSAGWPDFHVRVVPNEKLALSTTTGGISVVAMFVDSVSRGAFFGRMPRTMGLFRSYLARQSDNTPAVIDFRNFNSISGGTYRNMPVLSCGRRSEDCPVSGEWWVHNVMKRAGYVTSFSGEECTVDHSSFARLQLKNKATSFPATLTQSERMDAFNHGNTLADHTLNNIVCAYDRYSEVGASWSGATSKNPLCFASKPLFHWSLEYSVQFMEKYPAKSNRFSWVQMAYAAHEGTATRLASADAPIAASIQRLIDKADKDGAKLAIALFSDHGIGFGKHFESSQHSKDHYKRPGLFFVLSSKLVKAHPELAGSLRSHQHSIVTAHDFYTTITHFSTYPMAPPSSESHGRSLIAKWEASAHERSCLSMGIDQSYCPCHE